jgi:DNA-binding transcriptional regulator YiaG
MTNHPNRSRRTDAPGRTPKPDEIRAAREAAGLSRLDAAALIYRSVRGWEKFESGERPLDPALWELWLLKIQARESTI